LYHRNSWGRKGFHSQGRSAWGTHGGVQELISYVREHEIYEKNIGGQLQLLYSSGILELIRFDHQKGEISVNFWAGHVLSDAFNVFTQVEFLKQCCGTTKLDVYPLEKFGGSNLEKATAQAIDKMHSKAQTKIKRGFRQIRELHCRISELEEETANTLISMAEDRIAQFNVNQSIID